MEWTIFASIMDKEIYLYSGIYDSVAERIIRELNARLDSPVTILTCSGGGNVMAFWGIARKMQEHGDVTYQVDGWAASSAANLMFYAKTVTCLDVSNFILHRADGYVSSPEDQKYLDKINVDLKNKMIARIGTNDFKAISGHSIDDLFDSEKRIDVYLNASQMKKLGLVDKIVKLAPEQVEAYENSIFSRMAASHNPEPVKNSDMTLEKLKAEFPAVYAAIMVLGKDEGAKAEKARVAGWAAWQKADPAAVAAGIAGDACVDMNVISTMSAKLALAGLGKAAEGEAAVDPTKAQSEAAKPATEAEKAIGGLSADVDKLLGRKAVAAV